MNLIYIHLLNKRRHSEECALDEMRGLICADDCEVRAFLDELEAPLLPSEIAEEERIRQRRKELMRGNIPA